MKAIAYTTDIILGKTGDVISQQYQRTEIEKYARENNIDIIAWFQDDMYNENVLDRNGIKQMLSCKEQYDLILVERVWVFSRTWNTINNILNQISSNVKLETTTILWDCISQMVRHKDKKCSIQRNKVQCSKPISVKPPKIKHFDFLYLYLRNDCP